MTEKLTPIGELRKQFPGAYEPHPFGAQAWLGEFTLWLSDHNSDTEWDLGIYDDEHLANGEPNVLLVLHPNEVEPTLQALKLTAAKPTQARLVQVYCQLVRANEASRPGTFLREVLNPENRFEVHCELDETLRDLGWDGDDSDEREDVLNGAYGLVWNTLVSERDSA